MGIWPNTTGMVTGWSPTKIVQMVLIGCIRRSRGQTIGFQKAIFKNLLWNYKAQSFHIWYITSSRGPLLKLFKLCPWGQNWPRLGGHNFTLIYIRKTAKDFFSWTTNGNLTKLNRNGPWVVFYQNCSNYPPGVLLTPPRGPQFYIELYKENCKRLLLLNG